MAKVKIDLISNKPVNLIMYLSAVEHNNKISIGVNGYLVNEEYGKAKTSDRPAKFTITSFGYVDNNELARFKDAQPLTPSFYYSAYTTVDKKDKTYFKFIFDYIENIKLYITQDLDVMYNAAGVAEGETILDVNKFYLYLDHGVLANVFLEENKEVLQNFLELDHKGVEEFISRRNEVYKIGKQDNVITLLETYRNNVGLVLANSLAKYAEKHNEKTSFKLMSRYDVRFWDVKNDIHPMINFKQLFFTDVSKDTNTLSVMEYPSNVTIGKKTNEAAFGVVKLADLDKLIKDALDAYEISSGTYRVLSSLNLGSLFSPDNIRLTELTDGDVYDLDYNNYFLRNVINTDIVYPVTPAGLATKVFNNMQDLYSILDGYSKQSNSGKYRYLDVTKDFYNVEGDKYTISIPNGSNEVTLIVNEFGKTLKIPLELGKDTLSRNNLKNLEKLHPKITLVLQKDENESIVYYYTIVECDDGLGIYTSLYANKIITK